MTVDRQPQGTWVGRALAILLALAIAAPAVSAERAWRTLDAQHYRVVSQLSDRETLAWTREFDQFIASMAKLLRLNPQQLPPLTVMLLTVRAASPALVKVKLCVAESVLTGVSANVLVVGLSAI